MKVLLTGGTGFVGKPLLQALSASGHEVISAVRQFLEHDALAT